MQRIVKSLSFVLCLSGVLALSSCRSVRHPREVAQPINYSDEDIVQNEIERIKNNSTSLQQPRFPDFQE